MGNALLALAVYVACSPACSTARCCSGLIDEAASWPLTAWNLGGGLMFVLLVRSGLNLKLARKGDPGLSIPQMLWAITGICWSYGITGPARGAVILILLPVLIYCVFSLNARQSRKLTAAAFLMLAAVMPCSRPITDPARYEPRASRACTCCSPPSSWPPSRRWRSALAPCASGCSASAASWREALERIQLLATHDELTGLTNRRAATERMREELAAAHAPAAAARSRCLSRGADRHRPLQARQRRAGPCCRRRGAAPLCRRRPGRAAHGRAAGTLGRRGVPAA